MMHEDMFISIFECLKSGGDWERAVSVPTSMMNSLYLVEHTKFTKLLYLCTYKCMRRSLRYIFILLEISTYVIYFYFSL